MSYLPPEHALAGAQLAVEYMGERYPCTVAVAGLDARLRPRQQPHPQLMDVLVAVKRVPITGGRIVLTDDAQAIDTRHLGFTISPHEECAAEEAVRLIEAHGGASTVLTLGPPEAEEQLRDALAIGIDDAIHLVTGEEEWDPQATAARDRRGGRRGAAALLRPDPVRQRVGRRRQLPGRARASRARSGGRS